MKNIHVMLNCLLIGLCHTHKGNNVIIGAEYNLKFDIRLSCCNQTHINSGNPTSECRQMWHSLCQSFNLIISFVSVAPSDSITPLNLSHSDVKRLTKLAKSTNSHNPDLSRQCSSTRSEPSLQRQGSMISNLGSSMRRKMSTAGQVMAREEARTAKVKVVQ